MTRVRDLREALIAAALGLLGLLCIAVPGYSFVAYRAFHPPTYQWPIDQSWIGIVRHVSGSLYSRYLGGFAPQGLQLALIMKGVLPAPIGVPLVGLSALLIRDRIVRAWLVAMTAGVSILAVFVFLYRVTDPAAYFGPAIMLASLLFVIVARWLSRYRFGFATLCVLMVALAPVWFDAIHSATEQRAGLDQVDRNIRSAWGRIPFDRGFVVWLDDYSARLEIFRILEHQRPQLTVINPNLLTWPVNRLRFARQFGFDPLDGVGPNYWQDLPEHLHRTTNLPVVLFPSVLEGH